MPPFQQTDMRMGCQTKLSGELALRKLRLSSQGAQAGAEERSRNACVMCRTGNARIGCINGDSITQQIVRGYAKCCCKERHQIKRGGKSARLKVTEVRLRNVLEPLRQFDLSHTMLLTEMAQLLTEQA